MLDILSLNPADTEALLRRLFGRAEIPTPMPRPELSKPVRTPRARKTAAARPSRPVELGDTVRMLDDGREGIVMRLEGERARVLFGWEDNGWFGREEFRVEAP